MKLDNNGWGYRDMIIYTCIILFALIFVAISISSFYDGMVEDLNTNKNSTPIVSSDDEEEYDFDEDVILDEDYYKSQENILKDATLQYVMKYSYDLSDDILIVSMDTLISLNFMEQIYDQTGNYKCNGYSNVYLNGDDYGIVPYLSCNNYVTSGY